MFIILISHTSYILFPSYIVVHIFVSEGSFPKYNMSLSVSLLISYVFSLSSLPAFRYASFFKTGGPLSRRSFYGRICNFKLTGSRTAPRCFDVGRPLARLAHREISWSFLLSALRRPLRRQKGKERERERRREKKDDGSFPRSPLRRSSSEPREI